MKESKGKSPEYEGVDQDVAAYLQIHDMMNSKDPARRSVGRLLLAIQEAAVAWMTDEKKQGTEGYRIISCWLMGVSTLTATLLLNLARPGVTPEILARKASDQLRSNVEQILNRAGLEKRRQSGEKKDGS